MFSKIEIKNYSIISALIGLVLLVSGVVSWLGAVANVKAGCDVQKKTNIVEKALNPEAVEIQYKLCLSRANTSKKVSIFLIILGLIIFILGGIVYYGFGNNF